MKKIDIRKKDKKISFKYLWLMDQFEKLRASAELAALSDKEISEYLLKKYEERKVLNGRLYNNADNKNKVLTQEQFINMYLNESFILSGYSCFYQNQDNSINISSAALENLGSSRKKYKKMMEAAEHGSDDYIYYRILQLTFKVLMNSYYGILGQKDSVFYNSFVQNSITSTGQDLITTSIIAMEAFLGNNVKFEDTDAVINFIMNIKSENYDKDILSYIDTPVSKDELLEYLLKQGKVELDRDIIKSYITNLDTEMANRIYYKNNILEFIKNSSPVTNLFRKITQYNYAEKPDKEIEGDVEEVKDILLEFCFYNCLYDDRYKRAVKDFRDVVITIDTDSNFINVNPHIEMITKTLNLDKENENQQMTIMNTLIYIVTATLKETFWTLTTNMGLVDRAKPLINMKQEFLYRRILLTQNKKSYAGIITAELGNILPKPQLDIKGLSIKKTTIPKKLRREFTKILEEDVLKAKQISLKNILNKYDALGKSIEDSLRSGNVEYTLPKNLEMIENYKAPDTIEPIRAMLIWNALEPEDTIVPPEKINMLKLNCTDENDPRLLKLKETHPSKYNAIMKVVFNHNVTGVKIDISRFGFSCIAIPKSVEKIPDYLLPFIDYTAIVNANMTNGYIILESLGIYCDTVGQTKYKSNIISI